MTRRVAARGGIVSAVVIAVAVTLGPSLAFGGTESPAIRWRRLDASIDVASWVAGQATGVIRVWGAHAYSHVDDSPAARAVGSPMDVGVFATAASFKGARYPLTSESLSPGGEDKAEFAEASRSIDGTVRADHLFSRASTTADPPMATADGGAQSAATSSFKVSNYRAISTVGDDGKGRVVGNGVVSLDDVVVGPLFVRNVTTLLDGASDGTEAGTTMSARTLVTGATVAGIPVEIGSDGVMAADQRAGSEMVATLNQQIKTALQVAGVFEVVATEPKTSHGSSGLSLDAGGLRVKFTPTPEMSKAVNAAVPVEAAFASGRGNFLAIRQHGGVVEPDVPFDPPTFAGPGASPSSADAGVARGSPTAPSRPVALPYGGAGSLSVSPVVVAGPDGPAGTSLAADTPGSARGSPGPGLLSLPVGRVRPNDGPWVAGMVAMCVVVLAAMVEAARRAAAAGLAQSRLSDVMATLTRPEV
jgi:hypothetical protein